MTLDLSWICFPVGFVLYAAATIFLLNVRWEARALYEKEVRRTEASGAFQLARTPQAQRKWRIRIQIAFGGLLIAFASAMALVLNYAGVLSFSPDASRLTGVGSLVSWIVCVAAAALNQLEINRIIRSQKNSRESTPPNRA
jgi:hypothetical protein